MLQAENNKIKSQVINKRVPSKVETFAIVSEDVGNYETHPFFVKKAKAAKEHLRKVGLPKELKAKLKSADG